MWSYLAELECTACGETWSADRLRGLCDGCGKVLFARYDLRGAKSRLTPAAVSGRPWNMWRYHEVLPVRDAGHMVTLGEGATPLLRISAPERWGIPEAEFAVKDEGLNPTGSFKSRGLAVAVSRALELGATEIALPSAGNAGAAAAAYAAAAGIPAHVAVPADVPAANLREMEKYGAEVLLVDGLIDEAGRQICELATERGWFDLSTLKEPYRADGKKTMAYELVEQGGFGDDALPDVIVYPWRRDGDRRDVEGIRRTGGIGMDRSTPASHGDRPSRWLRSIGARFRDRPVAGRTLGTRSDRSRRDQGASGHRGLSDPRGPSIERGNGRGRL